MNRSYSKKRMIQESNRKLELRYLMEEDAQGMDIEALSGLSNIEGVQDIPGCKTDSFDATECLTNAMDKLTFNVFVKQFLPALQTAKVDTSSVPKIA